jgi:uncharacterized protein (DUF1684 family)
VAPSQLEIDLLAVFIETAEELRHEPFFDLYENTRYSTQDKKLYVIEFGDRFHLRSALIPFRRMWRNGEDSYYADILDLIVKYEPNAAPAAASFRSTHERLETKPALPPHVTLPGKEVVDGWLYSVFVHTNLKRSRTRPGDYDRRIFEQNVKAFGHAWYEYAFRETVRSAGWTYFQIVDWLAQPLFNRWRAAKYEPSFQISYAFGTAKREKMPDGTVIIRRSSSLYGVDETLIQKFFRLLRRFSNLKDIFKSLRMSDEELLKRFVEARSIRELIKAAGFEFHLADYYKPKDGDVYGTATLHDSVTNEFGSYCSTRDWLIIASKSALRSWSREFRQFKALLVDARGDAEARPRSGISTARKRFG